MKDVFQKHLKTFALETLSLLGTHLTKAATDAKSSRMTTGVPPKERDTDRR